MSFKGLSKPLGPLVAGQPFHEPLKGMGAGHALYSQFREAARVVQFIKRVAEAR
jgi:hypothetical protein